MLRDDGPLAGVPAAGRLPLPEPLLLAAALLVAVPGAALLPGWLDGAAAGTADGAAAGAAWTWPWAWVAAGLVLAVLGRFGGVPARLAWPAPALLRAVEYGAVLVLAGGSAGSYGLLAALAFHHYDVVYRLQLLHRGPPRWFEVATGGWPGRMVLLVVAAASGQLDRLVAPAAIVLGAVFVTESVVTWRRAA